MFEKKIVLDGRREWILLECKEEYIRHHFIMSLNHLFEDLDCANVLVSGKMPNWFWLSIGAHLVAAGAKNIGIWRPGPKKFHVVFGDLRGIFIEIDGYEPPQGGVRVLLNVHGKVSEDTQS